MVPTPHDLKQLHDSEYNSHESEMVPLSGDSSVQKVGGQTGANQNCGGGAIP